MHLILKIFSDLIGSIAHTFQPNCYFKIFMNSGSESAIMRHGTICIKRDSGSRFILTSGFFHQSNIFGPLIHHLKYFQFRFKFAQLFNLEVRLAATYVKYYSSKKKKSWVRAFFNDALNWFWIIHRRIFISSYPWEQMEPFKVFKIDLLL